MPQSQELIPLPVTHGQFAHATKLPDSLRSQRYVGKPFAIPALNEYEIHTTVTKHWPLIKGCNGGDGSARSADAISVLVQSSLLMGRRDEA